MYWDLLSNSVTLLLSSNLLFCLHSPSVHQTLSSVKCLDLQIASGMNAAHLVVMKFESVREYPPLISFEKEKKK